MPAITLQTDAFVIGQQQPTDSFQAFTLFCPEQGVLTARQRLAKRGPSQSVPLDLFDHASFLLESSNQGRSWFVREVRLITRHAAIGRSYESLRAASVFASVIARNSGAEESRPAVAALLAAAFGAFASDAEPDLVLFKSLFRFARDEGYPVGQQWFPSLPAELRSSAEHLLRTPLAEIDHTTHAAAVPLLLNLLEAYIRTETDILIK